MSDWAPAREPQAAEPACVVQSGDSGGESHPASASMHTMANSALIIMSSSPNGLETRAAFEFRGEVNYAEALAAKSCGSCWIFPGLFWGLPTADCRLPTADCRLPTADCRLPTADCRLPTTDCGGSGSNW